MCGQPAKSNDSKPSDPVRTQYNPYQHNQDRNLSDLQGLTSSEHVKSKNQEIDCLQLASRNQAVPDWLYGLLDSRMNSSNAAKPSSPNAAPNLELTLAAPRPLEQNKSSPEPLVLCPISLQIQG